MLINKIFRAHNIPVQFFVFLFFIYLFSLFFFTCSSPTSDSKKVTFSGTVTLEGESDYSGVTVALYELVELDTALVKINQEYPTIGVQISQETEFDHRELEPLASTTTAADGSWEIKVEEGVYNLVVEKEGFGWKYMHETGQGIYNTDLKKVINLSANILEIPSGSFVEITENITFSNDLIINTPVTLLFKNDGRVTINGNITFLNDAFTYLYNDESTSFNNTNIVIKSDDNIEIDKVVFFDAFNSIYINNSTHISITKSIFKSSPTCIDIFNSDNVFISNSIFNKCGIAVESEGSNSILSKNIVGNFNSKGYNIGGGSSSLIEQNLFYNGNYAIDANPGYVTIESTIIANNNDFIDNSIHFRIGWNVNVQVNYNNFLENESYAVRVSNSINVLDFTLNFWLVFSDYEIGQLIYDMNDNDQLGLIDFSDFLTEKVNWP